MHRNLGYFGSNKKWKPVDFRTTPLAASIPSDKRAFFLGHPVYTLTALYFFISHIYILKVLQIESVKVNNRTFQYLCRCLILSFLGSFYPPWLFTIWNQGCREKSPALEDPILRLWQVFPPVKKYCWKKLRKKYTIPVDKLAQNWRSVCTRLNIFSPPE